MKAYGRIHFWSCAVCFVSLQEAYEKLMMIKTEKDGMVYWKKASETEEEDNMADMPFWRRHTGSTSSSIEMTSYALLTMAYR